ncbi:MAG: vWA domain-containing protein [Gaiellaceae bacterium]
MTLRGNRGAIPLADARSLRGQARRTVVVRAALGLLALAALASAIAVSRDANASETRLFAGRDSGVLVVDLSASIGAEPHARIGRALRRLLDAGSPFGLVFFSDVAYEALPPGMSAQELRPLLRFFTPRPRRPDFRRRFRPARRPTENPWSALRGGTRISTGLALARRILRREGDASAGVLLVSDLDNSLFDNSALTRTLSLYRADGIPLRIVGLSPSRDDQRFFERVVGENALVSSVELAPRTDEGGAKRVAVAAAFPTALVAALLALLGLLAANEHWCARLRWRDRGETA